MAGKPMSGMAARASSRLDTYDERGHLSPIFSIAFLNRSRSSAFSIDGSWAPMSLTPCFDSTPARAASTARLSPVCPPRVGRMALGRSRSSTLSSTSTVSGST